MFASLFVNNLIMNYVFSLMVPLGRISKEKRPHFVPNNSWHLKLSKRGDVRTKNSTASWQNLRATQYAGGFNSRYIFLNTRLLY
jgi:hypothetical protein